MIKVLVADDHRLVAQGLKMMLEEQDGLDCVGVVQNGKQVLSFLTNQEADVILMDIEMPVMDGLQCTEAVTKKWPEIRILALSSYDKASFVEQMLRSGAAGYLLKNTEVEELVKAIHTVMRGEKYLGMQAQRTLLDSISTQRKGLQPSLTRRENEVLKLIAKELTTQEIAGHLGISVNTVESHRRNLLSKFDVRNSIGLIQEAMKQNLL